VTQQATDSSNAEFWDELCGSGLARSIGVTDASPSSLARFDAAYLDFYPYLRRYYASEPLEGARVLEIGLGYGTLSSELARRGCRYHGLDIARGPVQMVRERLRMIDRPADEAVVQGSALSIPHPDDGFDYVYSIGCLHHTGDLPAAVGEVRRVLRPGGKAVVMLYNRHSLRQLLAVDLRRLLRRDPGASEVRATYDSDAEGNAAPHTDYVSRRDVRRLFAGFSDVRIEARNFDDTRVVPRTALLGNADRLLGLDLYIVATK